MKKLLIFCFVFLGKNCQINIDECFSQPCQNDGTCIRGTNGYFCNCTQNYRGNNCEIEYDACASNPCHNNGTCKYTSRSKHDYVCVSDVNDCIDGACPENKVCVHGINGSECKCKDGYREPNCTLIVDQCLKKPCKNNGTCVDLGEQGFSCKCAEGFEGNLFNNI